MKHVRVIVNGKGAGKSDLRAAVHRLRDEGQPVEVRCTWERGDAERFAREAVREGVDVLVAGGGDGTLHEVVNGVIPVEAPAGIALGVLPLGTANDFARSCGIPAAAYDALKLAATGNPVPIDVADANGVCFINVASGGFGAEVTSGTPAELKQVLGSGGYALVGLFTAGKMTPYEGRLVAPTESVLDPFIALAVGNGRQAGGGFPVAPKAYLNDGLLDLMVISGFRATQLAAVIEELQHIDEPENRFVHYRQSPAFEIEVPATLPINLDGEPYRWDRVAFAVRPKAVRMVLPEGCALLKTGS